MIDPTVSFSFRRFPSGNYYMLNIPSGWYYFCRVPSGTIFIYYYKDYLIKKRKYKRKEKELKFYKIGVDKVF